MNESAAWVATTTIIAIARAASRPGWRASTSVRAAGLRLDALREQAAEHVELDVGARDVERAGQRHRLRVEHELAVALREPEPEALALAQPPRADLAEQRDVLEAVEEQVALHDVGQPLLGQRGQLHLPRAVA